MQQQPIQPKAVVSEYLNLTKLHAFINPTLRRLTPYLAPVLPVLL